MNTTQAKPTLQEAISRLGARQERSGVFIFPCPLHGNDPVPPTATIQPVGTSYRLSCSKGCAESKLLAFLAPKTAAKLERLTRETMDKEGLKFDHKPLPKPLEAHDRRELASELGDIQATITPTTGKKALDDVMSFVRRFVDMSEAQARAAALFVAHCYCIEAADYTPYLLVTAAEKRCGKSRLLDVLKLLVPTPWKTERASAAVLVRKIDAEAPTLLLDESDAAFSSDKKYSEVLRSILDSGFKKGGCSSLCVGEGKNIGYKDFHTFCPKVIAGIGRLPDTVEDRGIPIRLKRAKTGTVERFRERDAKPKADDIVFRLKSWCAANIEALKKARPAVLLQIQDRQFDTTEPLFAIADRAGGDWPQGARRALVELCTGAQLDDGSVRVKLLSDIRQVYAEKGVDELSSQELCDNLAQFEGSPWAEWSRGKPVTTHKLAGLLKPFEVHPRQIQRGQSRGYSLASFGDAFSRYLLPDTPLYGPQSVKVSSDQYSCGFGEVFKVSTKGPDDTLEKSVSPSIHAGLGHFDTLKPEKRGVEGEWGLFSDDEVTI